MADNYLEKKMEQHKQRSAPPARAKTNLLALLDKCSCCTAFGDYEVRPDQLRRAVTAAAKVDTFFRYKLFVADAAAALRAKLSPAGVPPASGYIAVCASGACDRYRLGRVVQAMLVQIAEAGLSSFVASEFDLSLLPALPETPLLVIAVGRSAELSLGLNADAEPDDFII